MRSPIRSARLNTLFPAFSPETEKDYSGSLSDDFSFAWEEENESGMLLRANKPREFRPARQASSTNTLPH